MTTGVVWTAPVVQAIAPAANASTSIPCVGCLTGGGQILTGTVKGKPADKISFGLGPICCPTHDPTQIEVVCHAAVTDNKKKKKANDPGDQYHFTEDDVVTCRKTGDPSPPPKSKPCANVYRGIVKDKQGNVLQFEFTDGGEPSNNDKVRITITSPAGVVLCEGAGDLDHGNLQVHPHLGPIKHECEC